VEVGVQVPSARPERSDVEARVARVAEPIAAGMGLSLVKVHYQGTRTQGALRLTIDKPGGVTLDDCTRLSRAVGHALDVEEPIDHRYALEVSSPGLDRPLTRPDDYRRFAGRSAKVVLKEPVDGQKYFKGRLGGVDAGYVLIEGEDRRTHRVPLGVITRANLEVEF